METIVTVEHIRQHVVEDAGDLISLVGLLNPIVTLRRLQDADDVAHAARLLRKLLSRDLILIVCRLHELAGQRGPTGIVASIEALLDIAATEIGNHRAAELKQKRREIIADLELEGIKFTDLRSFRNAEIAHSLHRTSRESDKSLYYHSIVRFCRQTYELILGIERELVLAGSTPFSDLPDLDTVWERRGLAIWNKTFNS